MIPKDKACEFILAIILIQTPFSLAKFQIGSSWLQASDLPLFTFLSYFLL